MEELTPLIEEIKPLAIAFGAGILVTTLLTIVLTFFGWRSGKEYFISPPFSLFNPMITVTWESNRFSDLLLLLNLFLSGAVLWGVYTYVLTTLSITIAAGIGMTVALIKPYLGNIFIGIIDRYDIEPTPRNHTNSRSNTSNKWANTVSEEEHQDAPNHQGEASDDGSSSHSRGWRPTRDSND